MRNCKLLSVTESGGIQVSGSGIFQECLNHPAKRVELLIIVMSIASSVNSVGMIVPFLATRRHHDDVNMTVNKVRLGTPSLTEDPLSLVHREPPPGL